MARGEWYLDDAEPRGLRELCARKLDAFNGALASDDDARLGVLLDLLSAVGRGALVVPRFSCSYGHNIELGDRAFVNANAFFMDDARISIGPDVRLGPGVQLMTALHPVDDHARRRAGWERAAPITIEDNAWLGAAVVVGAGVTIGRNAVVRARGVPARVIRRTPIEAGTDRLSSDG